MAAKRLTAVNINWAAFLERAPPTQSAQALAFKSKIDGYVRKMTALPEKPPGIEWAYYKSRISIPGLVDNFQKKYESLTIPFPTDTLSAQIDQERQERLKEVAAFVQEVNADIKETEIELQKLHSIPPYEDMTMEDFQEHYPQLAINTFTRPSHWPHTEEELADGEYYAKTGKIPPHLDIYYQPSGHAAH